MTQTTLTLEQEAMGTIEDAILALRSTQANVESKSRFFELQEIIDRLYDLTFKINDVSFNDSEGT